MLAIAAGPISAAVLPEKEPVTNGRTGKLNYCII